MSAREPVSIEVWSDIACPWCWIGKRRLEAALARVERAEDFAVRWRSFELDPHAPARPPAGVDYAERLARKYRCSRAEGERMIESMTAAGAAEGLELRFDRALPGNTFDAHRLLHAAGAHGVREIAVERLFRAYLNEGLAIGERSELATLGDELGLPPDEVARVLESDAYGEAVRADEAEARMRDIHGVPYFRVAGRFGLSGAQPPEMLARVFEEARREAGA